jgi:hypothetical protein
MTFARLVKMRLFGRNREECKHLVNYQGTNIDIAGISIPNIFSLGNVKINPQVLQAAENAIKLLDLRHFQNCEDLKQISDETTKVKFIENMNKQQDKLSNIAMAIDAYKINPNSQKLEESLTNLLESNLPLPDSDKENVKKTLKVDISQQDIKAKGDVEGGEVKARGINEGEFDASQQKIESEGKVKGSKVEIN